MKKIFIGFLSVMLIFSVCSLSVSAVGDIIENDKFIAEIPDGFEINTGGGYDHYYLEDVYDYNGDIEIFVEGNILIPDGVENTENELINERIKEYFYSEGIYTNVVIQKAEKKKINGLTVYSVFGDDNGEKLWANIYTTKENLYIVLFSSFSLDEEPEYFKEFSENFYINGTHYNGESLTIKVDFSNKLHYIDALERDVLNEEYHEYNSNIDVFATIFAVLGLSSPIISIIFLILFVRTRKKLNSYREFFGDINDVKRMMNIQTTMNAQNGQFNGFIPTSVPYNTKNNNGQYSQFPNQNQNTQTVTYEAQASLNNNQ